ncbi:MAG: O-antigen/teichoic acid export membrane protein [Planctomycetota bacterium]|jgi:O-antigen/teichoic acid export membrane protein
MISRPNEFDDRSLARSSSWGVIAQAVHLGSRLLLTPLVVSFVGLGTYAYWSLIFAVLGWLGLHRIGFVASAIPLASKCISQEDVPGAERFLRGASNLSLVLGAVATTSAFLFGRSFIEFLGVTADLQGEAHAALLITLFATSVALVLGGFQSALEATNKFPRVKGIEVCCALSESIVVVLFLTAGWGLVGMACAYALRLVSQVFLCAIYARKQFPTLRPWPGRSSKKTLVTLLRFGGSMQVIGFLHLSVAFVDRMFVVTFLGLISSGVFELTRKLVNFGAGLIAQGLSPVAPATARLQATQPSQVQEFIGRTIRMTSLFGVLPLAWLSASSHVIIHAWLGSVPPHSELILSVLSIAAYIHLMTGPWTAVLRGLERTKEEFTYTATWLVLVFVLLPTGFEFFGLYGVLVGSAAAQGLSSGVLIVLAKKSLTPNHSIIPWELGRPVLAILPAFLLSRAISSLMADGIDRWASFSACLVAGVTLVAAYLPLAWLIVLTPSDRRFMLSLVSRSKIGQREDEMRALKCNSQ